MYRVYAIIAFIISVSGLQSYEIVWESRFNQQEGYGYHGSTYSNIDNDWTINLRGCLLDDDSTIDWFKVKNGVLEAKDIDISYQLQGVGIGAIWSSADISIDSNSTYLLDVTIDGSPKCDKYNCPSWLEDFVKVYYLDENREKHDIGILYGPFCRNKFSGKVEATSQCNICVEVDCSAETEYYRIMKVRLVKVDSQASINDLLISKLCVPAQGEREERYMQISNIGSEVIDLSNLKIQAISSNSSLYDWDLNGLIFPDESFIIGDSDFLHGLNVIARSKWSAYSDEWDGVDEDGAQIIATDRRYIVDRVVGVDFNDGYVERASGTQSTQELTSPSNWIYHEATTYESSEPGNFILEETLAVLFTDIYLNNWDSNVKIYWTALNESDIIAYNIFYSVDKLLENAIRINREIIEPYGNNIENNYSYELDNIETNGTLWVEVVYYNNSREFSKPLIYEHSNTAWEDTELVIPIEESITVFPNPISVETLVKINNGQKTIDFISLYNIKGQKLDELKIASAVKQVNISKLLDKVNSGCYILRVKSGDRYVQKKIIKSD
jgi:hypothetical protein